MVWKMDPFSMPGRFCTAQSIFIALGIFLMTGAVSILSYITHMIVLKPKTWADKQHEAFEWRLAYCLPTVLFPAAALSIHLALVLKLSAVRPAIEFYCDSSNPQWIRFLTYAGTPMPISLITLVLSIKSLLRIRKVNEHIQRARASDMDMDCTENSDAYTRPSRLNFKRSLRRKTPKSEKQAIDFDDTLSKASDIDSTYGAPSLHFTVPPFRVSTRISKASAHGFGGARMNTPSPAALRNSVQSAASNSLKPTSVHFHIPAKPPSSSSDQSEQEQEYVNSRGMYRNKSFGSIPDSDAHSASSIPTITSSPANPHDSKIAEVGRARPSSADSVRHGNECHDGSCEQKQQQRSSLSPNSNTTRSPSDGGQIQWESVTEVDSPVKEKTSTVLVEEGSVLSDNKGEETEGDFDYLGLGLDELGRDPDTLSEEMKAQSGGASPKYRTHTKSFNNDAALPSPFRCKRPPLHNIPGPIWRLILFQIAFVSAQLLGSISTLIDVVRQSPPSPLGTHHFTLLFVAWSPLFFFGCLRGVRQNAICCFRSES